eukprot:6754085-Prymnesium_polylepis.1
MAHADEDVGAAPATRVKVKVKGEGERVRVTAHADHGVGGAPLESLHRAADLVVSAALAVVVLRAARGEGERGVV